MALRGTLKDFGIADILQLIGHQQKTGVLSVRSKDQEVQIYFREGAVLRAESNTRQKKELLGRMLVRAEVLSEEQLSRALDEQKRAQKKLGQLLVESGALDRKVLRQFTRLQTTETLYRLFLWEGGTYEFSQAEVPPDPEAEPIRAETVLMEGFRQVDEWPGIRKKVTAYNVSFERLQDLDELMAQMPAEEMGLDDAFSEFGGGDASAPSVGLRNIGVNERIVYQLIESQRDVQKIIDLSRLGEFETCKALVALIDADIIAQSASESPRPASADPTVGGIVAKPQSRVFPVMRGALTWAAFVVAIATVLVLARRELPRFVGDTAAWGFVETSLASELSASRERRLREALEVYRALEGHYPASLTDLVARGIVNQDDLSFPWVQPYFYERAEAGYVLLRPLY